MTHTIFDNTIQPVQQIQQIHNSANKRPPSPFIKEIEKLQNSSVTTHNTQTFQSFPSTLPLSSTTYAPSFTINNNSCHPNDETINKHCAQSWKGYCIFSFALLVMRVMGSTSSCVRSNNNYNKDNSTVSTSTLSNKRRRRMLSISALHSLFLLIALLQLIALLPIVHAQPDPAADPDATTLPELSLNSESTGGDMPTTTTDTTATTTTATPCTEFDSTVAGGQEGFFPATTISGLSTNDTIPGLRIDACFSETSPAAIQFPATGRPSSTQFPEAVFSFPGISSVQTSLALMNWINNSCVRVVLSPKTITFSTATATLKISDPSQLGYCSRLLTSPLPIVVLRLVADPTNSTLLDLNKVTSGQRTYDYSDAIKAAAFFELQAVGAASRALCAPQRMQSLFGSIRTVAPFAFWEGDGAGRGYVGAVVGTLVVLTLVGIVFLIIGFLLRVVGEPAGDQNRLGGADGGGHSYRRSSDETEMKVLIGHTSAEVSEGIGAESSQQRSIIGDDNSSPQWKSWFFGSVRPFVLGLCRAYSALWIHLLLAILPGALFSASQLLVLGDDNDENGGVAMGAIGFVLFAPLAVAAPLLISIFVTRVSVSVRYFGRPGAAEASVPKNTNNVSASLNRNNNNNGSSAIPSSHHLTQKHPLEEANNEEAPGVKASTLMIASSARGVVRHDALSEANAVEEGDRNSSVVAVSPIASPGSNDLSSPTDSEMGFNHGILFRFVVAWLYPSTVTLPRCTSRLLSPLASNRLSNPMVIVIHFAPTLIIGLVLGLPSSKEIASCTGLLSAAACLFALMCLVVGIIRPYRIRAENVLIVISYLLTAIELWLSALQSSLGDPSGIDEELDETRIEAIRNRLVSAITAMWAIHVVIVAAGRVILPIALLLFEDKITTDVGYDVPSSSQIAFAKNPLVLGTYKQIDYFVLCFAERKVADTAERERRRLEAEAKKAADEAEASKYPRGDVPDEQDMASPRNEDQPSQAIQRLESGRWQGTAVTVNPLPHQNEKVAPNPINNRKTSKSSKSPSRQKGRLSASVSPGSRSIHRNPYAGIDDLEADPLAEGIKGKIRRRRKVGGQLGMDEYSDCSTEDMNIREPGEESRDSGPRPLSRGGSMDDAQYLLYGHAAQKETKNEQLLTEHIPLTGAPMATDSAQNSSGDEK